MDGILLLNKPKGMTSHDCVFKIRKLIKIKKVGHTGTLDPDVTGVLPICIGRATKVVEYVTGKDKTYEAEVTLGFSTITEDSSGEVVERKQVSETISRKQIENVLHSLTGTINQTPPMFSAIKVNGKRLYEYARQGIEVERPTRQVRISELVLLDDRQVFEGVTISFRFRVTCSKGTYVRTLAVTIGEKLGYPAHMSDLIRTASGEYTLENCFTFEEIEEMVQKGTLASILFPLESALSHLPDFKINDKVAEKVKNGAVLSLPEELFALNDSEPFRVTDNQGECVAIYERHPNKPHLIKPVKVLINLQELKS
ncbi:tRNA pseudouridine(55) synthase TruB [Cytobacillus sp. S13-E01]|uniref:tRNA pseudouridine(55) synthase TruB n=1 Tax=Cytobacillus sp. S13-E01 TaxID=3031326 RepID=UPI0023D89A29|nr:tRNA pseudouridine(55) synthase TruB [Cytobacillus sp. S13-E01]MDF0725141.1 tRNA pseudouridine(55) synthase TruB [Cytobacillus sp. S13-E01]